MNAVACGISTRKYARSLEPLPEEADERSTSKSSMSRRYVAMTTKQMTKWLTMPLGDRHFPIVMIDGIHLGDHMMLIALGIDFEGKKQVLGLREGNTENSRVAKALLRDLVERGLDPERARLFVIDGAKALTSAILKVFRSLGAIHRCHLHKERNVLGHLPDHMHQTVKSALREAWGLSDATVAKRRLLRLASSLEADHPGAAASVKEGLDETLTLQRLGISGTLYKKLRSTNAIENLNSGIATYSKNVKRWQGGSMVVRWVSAAIVEAEKKFRDRWSFAGSAPRSSKRRRSSVVFKGGATSRSSSRPSRNSKPRMRRLQSASPKLNQRAAAQRRSTFSGTTPGPLRSPVSSQLGRPQKPASPGRPGEDSTYAHRLPPCAPEFRPWSHSKP